jgi:hypothetical protein
MDSTKFDTVTRTLSNGINRRSAQRGLVAGALAYTAGGAVLAADAKRRNRKHHKKHQHHSGHHDDLRAGDPCETDHQCGYPDSYLICDMAGGTRDGDRTCCGAYNATCGYPSEDGHDTAPYCCNGYVCENGHCIAP